MDNLQTLKQGRDLLLKLHKSLVDGERTLHESVAGPVTPAQFLGLLLEDPHFSWLRRFSTLIVEIDEMLAQKDGYSEQEVQAHLDKLRALALGDGSDDTAFWDRYQTALQQNVEAAALHGELRASLQQGN